MLPPRPLALVALALAAPAAGAADFARDVLPVLAENCFHCHGPDDAARKAGLRLDTEAGAFRKNKDRAMIVPGRSGESELIRRILSDDADERMPPPDSNRKLTPAQIDAIKKWVDEGAKWGRHWAYTPLPREVPVPPVGRDGTRSGSPIDAFIDARLAAEGLPASPPATPERWLRRVTLDLTGLPPTPAETDAFLADRSPDAHGQVVDRLLASPRYGERMAADWLDLARYADTHGYQMDRFRPMWAYRDWVIGAFNRLHMQTEEGGVVEEEFRVAYVADRVTTFGTAFLAQTLECCRCHDHKFDPLRQRDFYSLFAFFQNIDESGQTTYFTPAMPVPTLLLSTAEQDRKIAALRAAAAGRAAAAAAERAAAGPAFDRWLAGRAGDPPPPRPVAAFGFDEMAGDRSPNAVDPTRPAVVTAPTLSGDQPARADGLALVPGKVGRAVRLDGEDGFTFPGVGHFAAADPFALAVWLNPPGRPPRAVVLHHSKAPVDAGSRGYEVLLEGGRVAVGLHHMWPGDSLKVVTRRAVPADAWTHVAVSYDGSGRAAGVRVYLDGEPAELEVVRDGLRKDVTYEGGEPNLALGHRFRDNGFKGGRADELKVFNRAVTPLEAAHLAGRADLAAAWRTPAAALTAAQRAGLFELFLATAHEPAKRRAAELRAARQELNRFVTAVPEAMVMEEMPAPKPAFVLKRGAYDAPGERVTADVPGVLPPFPPDQPRNRLGLARWLTHPDHPLLARVTANRLWQQMFGTGLVETSDNFGSTGTPPTHPELLDWLARDLARDWDVKRALKQIALSDAYRRSSRPEPGVAAKDPYNRLLARHPVRRLSAEMLRDQALAASGLLVEKLGGPSVHPYQPAGLWDEAMGRPRYPQAKGPDLYRRSLYTVWKRTAPHPQLTTFDAADRSVCTARRQSTSTPLQALALLNDPQHVEAARFLGQRMLKEGGGTAADRVGWMFRTATGRRPTPAEAAVLAKLFDEQRAAFAAKPADAAKLLAVGEAKADPAIPPAELAAATAVAQAVLNHDEAVNRR